MTCSTNQFKGVSHIGEDLILNDLELNMKVWLDYGLMSIGAWFDVNVPTSGAYGGDFSTLKFISDRSYTDGQIWEGVRKDWVWETGINYTGENGTVYDPFQVSGVTVNGTGMTSADYDVNYQLGRLVFTGAQPTDATVKAAYSYRNVQVYRADDAPWWTELQFRSFRPEDIQYTQTSGGIGNWSIGGHHRIQLPAIIIESVPRGESSPYEIGNASLRITQDVLYHIIAEDRHTRNKLLDILRIQEDKTIWLFSSRTVSKSGAFPLNANGDKVNNNNYPELVSSTGGFRWKKCLLDDVVISEVESVHHRLHEGTARITHELIYGSI